MGTNLSVVLPVHNEAPILEANTLAIADHLGRSPLIDRFEILLACNGCVDASEQIGRSLAARYPDTIRSASLAVRGLGRAIREGIGLARYDMVMFYAVDLPFGLSVLTESVAALDGRSSRIVIGSKGHPASNVERGFARSLFSGTISALNRFIFGLRVKDTQGSLLFPKEIAARFGEALDNPGAFFQAQLVIYGARMGCDVIEIPVSHKEDRHSRGTRFKLLSDGFDYLRAMINERRKLARLDREMTGR